FIARRSLGSNIFHVACLTAAILLGVTLGFNFLFPSPARQSQLPVMFLLISAALALIYNRAVDIDKFTAAFALLAGATVAGLASVATDSLAFHHLLPLGGWENWLLVINHLAATALLGSVMLTMVFGHWYLVIPRLSIDPLKRLTQVLIASLAVRFLATGPPFLE